MYKGKPSSFFTYFMLCIFPGCCCSSYFVGLLRNESLFSLLAIMVASLIPFIIFALNLYITINSDRPLKMNTVWVKSLLVINLLLFALILIWTILANVELSEVLRVSSYIEQEATVQLGCSWALGVLSGTLVLLIAFLRKATAENPPD